MSGAGATKRVAVRMSVHEGAQLVTLLDQVLNVDADLHATLVSRYPAAMRAKASIEGALVRAGAEKRGDLWVM